MNFEGNNVHELVRFKKMVKMTLKKINLKNLKIFSKLGMFLV